MGAAARGELRHLEKDIVDSVILEMWAYPSVRDSLNSIACVKQSSIGFADPTAT